MRVAIYARTSRDEQIRKARAAGKAVELDAERDKVSVPQQVEDAESYAKGRGWTLDRRHIYIDEDVRGKVPPAQLADGARKVRPGLTALLGAVERREVDMVVVRKRDRLARGTRLTLGLYDYMRARKVGLACTHESLPSGDDASGMFTLTVLAAAAEMEAAKTSENVKAGLDYLRRRGLKVGAACHVFAYYDDPDKPGEILVDGEQASLVRKVFRKYVEDEQSARSLAKWLIEKHSAIKGKRRPNRPRWNRSSVRYMLANPRYVGLAPDHEGKLIRSAWPAIVDDALWRRAQDRLSRNRAGAPGRSRLLSGMLRCGHCGCVLHHVQRPRGGQWQCSSSVHWAHGDGRHAFVMSNAEWERWIGLFWRLKKWRRERKRSPEETTLEVNIARADENLKALRRKVAAGTLDADEFASVLAIAKQERAKLEARLAAIRAREGGTLEIRNWSQCSESERREALEESCLTIKVWRDRVETERLGQVGVFALHQRRGKARWEHALVPDGMLMRDTPTPVFGHPGDPPGLFRVDMSRWYGADFRPVGGDWQPKSKRCTGCRKVKPMGEYHASQKYRDGKVQRCKDCVRRYHKILASRRTVIVEE